MDSAPDSIEDMLTLFWANQKVDLHSIDASHDWKYHALPLARVKKVMKLDDDVKNMMISSEAPILFAKACEIFILELTMRAWVHTEDGKRRTLQKSDLVAALAKNDMYDFLIDIVPRDEDQISAGTANAQRLHLQHLRILQQQQHQQQQHQQQLLQHVHAQAQSHLAHAQSLVNQSNMSQAGLERQVQSCFGFQEHRQQQQQQIGLVDRDQSEGLGRHRAQGHSTQHMNAQGQGGLTQP